MRRPAAPRARRARMPGAARARGAAVPSTVHTRRGGGDARAPAGAPRPPWHHKCDLTLCSRALCSQTKESDATESADGVAKLPLVELNSRFYGQIDLGHPAQRGEVIYDTGSDVAWIYGKDCKHCDNRLKYDPELSETKRDRERDFTIQARPPDEPPLRAPPPPPPSLTPPSPTVRHGLDGRANLRRARPAGRSDRAEADHRARARRRPHARAIPLLRRVRTHHRTARTPNGRASTLHIHTPEPAARSAQALLA